VSKKLFRAFLIIAALVIFGLLAGAIGGALRPSGSLSAPASDYTTITYPDFIVIMLTAVSVMLTILAFIVAVAAFVGWTTLNTQVNDRVDRYLREEFTPGKSLHELFFRRRDEAPLQGVTAFNESFTTDSDAEHDKDY
jgi:hypothetical protein